MIKLIIIFYYIYIITVTRGIIYNVQEQPTLDTIELTIKHTTILRNNLNAMLNDEIQLYNYLKLRNKINKLQTFVQNDKFSDNDNNNNIEFKFHTPTHCGATSGEGEFVFMGRKRFQEIMLICAPRLTEWIDIVRNLNATDNAPCILES